MVLSVPEPCSLYPRRGTLSSDYDGLRVVEKGALDENAAYVASHQFVWGLYLDELLVYDFDADEDGDFDDIGGSDKRYYVLHDFLYSASAVIDPSATVLECYDYEPYGKPAFWSGDYSDTRDETQVGKVFLFTGQMYDPETGLYHYKRRALQPTLGRFLQHDLEFYADGMSLYEYVATGPSRFSDPLGREIFISHRLADKTQVAFRMQVLSALQEIIGDCAELFWRDPTPEPYFQLSPAEYAGGRAAEMLKPGYNPSPFPVAGGIRYRLSFKSENRSERCRRDPCWQDLRNALTQPQRTLIMWNPNPYQGFGMSTRTHPNEGAWLLDLNYDCVTVVNDAPDISVWEVGPADEASGGHATYRRVGVRFDIYVWHELIGHCSTGEGHIGSGPTWSQAEAMGRSAEDRVIRCENRARGCLRGRGIPVADRAPYFGLDPPAEYRR